MLGEKPDRARATPEPDYAKEQTRRFGVSCPHLKLDVQISDLDRSKKTPSEEKEP